MKPKPTPAKSKLFRFSGPINGLLDGASEVLGSTATAVVRDALRYYCGSQHPSVLARQRLVADELRKLGHNTDSFDP